MGRVSLTVLIGSLALGSAAFADSVVFNNPTGDLGLTETYTLDGANIVASGFNPGGTSDSAHLWGKNDGGDENGLGLKGDPTGDHEIWFKTSTLSSKDFIQLDLTDLLNKGFKNFQFEMGSTTDGEQWSVAACNVSGTLCSNASAVTGSGELAFHNVPSNFSSSNPYLDFTSIGNYGGKNVLLSAIAATPSIPEPRFYGFLLISILGVVGIINRKRRSI
jgi:hypothetical protein